jgi:hypothetical protein
MTASESVRPKEAPTVRGTTVLEAANYSAFETLRDGRRIEIRALRPDDRDSFMAAVNLSSPQSIYRRFFGQDGIFPKRNNHSFSIPIS